KLTCVENIDMDVQIIIPASDNTEYADFIPEGGVPRYPAFPDKFSGTRTDKSNETVNAGHGIGKPTKFASTIELEYGAALKNIEALKEGDVRRYTEATNHFTVGREEWILVGTVVKPFADDKKSSVRLVQSGDYYLYQMPHVYMHQAYANEEKVNWNTPFASLEEMVNYNQVFAINVTDEYGYYKLPADWYFDTEEPNPAMLGDGIVPKTFSFNGWFLNDEVYPEYDIKSKGNVLLSNTYPANIDIAKAKEENNGSFKVYNYDFKNFENLTEGEIRTQNGFLFCPTEGQNDGFFRITPKMLLNTSTKYKSATAQNPGITIMVLNKNGAGGSVATIKYDELKSDQFDASVDLINTVIENTPTQPEISVVMYGKELDNVVIPDLTQAIPLKLVCGAKMTVEFSPYKISDMETAVLEDREAGKQYNLLTEKPQIALAKGTYEGRFFLNLGVEEKEDLPTDGDDVTTSNATIDLYGNGNSIIISSSENVILKSAEITDMSGRTTIVDLNNPHYNKVRVKGAQGVYVVKAIGDTKTETAKVVVK
ncbi:MAG: T9SS type A sorting domain-containing protein, partial [Paludibacteraceae bacterium]|nr:T9SS type A sorting domain-containing protein [Paludibacteraceae bacterium]